MLEVKNLVKVYKTKGGAEVRALDGVSLSFEEKGMVFLLGRSGSGKSTLLNMCGGLDAPDSGEIIVKGKSSKDFTASDFDSYRNTYVGFVFQEYNILNEFSVEDNIAIALELQGKPKDKQEIARILEEVELTDFAKRKPNTLSGGQKQRVAIARALVKNPEIIMADEPTGALDSNTGKQVFDTLKKLSQDKLVIVVSHDRDFAEEYADRIIELKDGNVISDVTKVNISAKKESENLSLLQDNTLLIKKGSELTDKDLAKIKKLIASSKEDVLISTDKDDINLYKKSAKINDDNSKECFVPLENQPQADESQQQGKFIRSRLPMKHAFKIGASGIKTKPFRFILTLFLSTIAFIMFGLFSCLMYYDAESVVVNSLMAENIEYMNVRKNFRTNSKFYSVNDSDSYSYSSEYEAFLDDEDVDALSKKFGDKIIKVTDIKNGTIENLSILNSNYYSSEFTGFVESSEMLEYIEGGAPKTAGEVAISQYLYEAIKAGQLKNPLNGTTIPVNSLSDIVLYITNDNSRYVDNQYKLAFKVSGVFKNQNISDKYDAIKENNADLSQIAKLKKTIEEQFVSYIAINGQYYNDFKQLYGRVYLSSVETGGYGERLSLKYNETDSEFRGNFSVEKLTRLDHYIDLKGNIKKVSDTANKIVLSCDDAYYYFYCLDSYFRDLNIDGYFYEKIYEDMSCMELIEYISRNFQTISEEEFIAKFGVVADFINKNAPGAIEKFSVVELAVGEEDTPFKKDVQVIGFALNNSGVNAYLPDNYYDEYAQFSKLKGRFKEETTKFDLSKQGNAKYYGVFVAMDNSADNLKNLITNTGKYADDDSMYKINNSLKDNIDGYSSMVTILEDVFLWMGIALAVFSMLLLFNFIAVSISAKKKEIGILRAVGARGSDVFKIFFVEAIIIVVVCIVLSILLTAVLCNYINNTISKQMGMAFSLFTFGILSVVTIIGIALVTAFVSTFIPVYNYAKKKPVESIRSL